jgi:hypothetical protein
MSSYLERYERGEHEQVWDELLALGSAVYEEPLHTDALAVARATMRRARSNIEMLIPRLVAVGYQFGYGWVQPYVRERLLRPYRINYGGRFGALVEPTVPERFTYGHRAAYEEYLDLARRMTPLFAPATDREEQIASLERAIAATAPSQQVMREHLRAMQAELRAKPSAQDLLGELEAFVGTIPLSVRAWYEEVGGVNFVGDHPAWRDMLPDSVATRPMTETDYLNPMYVLNPLLIYSLVGERVAHARMHAESGAAGQAGRTAYPLTLALGGRMQYLDSGATRGSPALHIMLPTAAMDAPCVFPGRHTFVAYLRESFRWGGFPGWAKLEKRPEQDLEFLTQPLVPL